MRMALSPRARARATDESLQRALLFIAERAWRADMPAAIAVFERVPDVPPTSGEIN
jgi:hypothetical protein